MIDWKPISDMPEELKDGREVLLRALHYRRKISVVGRWSNDYGGWVSEFANSAIGAVTHYAIINPPKE